MQENPKVSIIIPVYNRERKLVETLNNVLNNNYRPIELLLIDDGSTDKSLQILKNFRTKYNSEDFEIKLYVQENKGAPAARNKGLEKSTGEYIQFLDSDDYLDSNKISEQIRALSLNKKKVAICDFNYVDSFGAVKSQIRNTGNLIYKLSKGQSIFISTPLFHNYFYKKGLLWDESLKRNQDIDYLFKLLLMDSRYVYTEGYWSHYVIHNENQISDSYKTTSPEYKKRIKSLIYFGFEKIQTIPLKNLIYLLLGILALQRRSILFNFRKFLTSRYLYD